MSPVGNIPLAVNNFGDTREGALAGPLALAVVAVLAVATILLWRNMNARLRRLPKEFPADPSSADPAPADPSPADPSPADPLPAAPEGAGATDEAGEPDAKGPAESGPPSRPADGPKAR